MKRINQKLFNFIIQNNNMITTAQILSLGFSKQLPVKYVSDGLLERIRHGVYILPDSVHDDMYTLMLSSENIIFSHESALFINGLFDRTPFIHTITMPSSKTLPHAIKNECNCFYIKTELHNIGLVEKINNFGNKVRCYDMERTLCDFIRTRSRCDEETVISAIKNYALYKNKNLERLAEYAKIFKVFSDVKKYMEVLL